jgi:hypothetical protein
MDLALRVNRDLRPFAIETPRMLASYAARLPPEAVEEFAARPEAIDYVEGTVEVLGRVDGITLEDQLAFMSHPGELAMAWKPGVDEKVMDGAALAIHYATEALYQGRLGQWPAMCVATSRDVKLAWSMPQLLDVMEPKLLDLEQKISEQESRADKTPRLPWFDMIKPGTMPTLHPWNRGLSYE